MSFVPEIVADDVGRWFNTGLYFATKQEAENNVLDLASKWGQVRRVRIVESPKAPNVKYINKRLITITRHNPLRGGRRG